MRKTLDFIGKIEGCIVLADDRRANNVSHCDRANNGGSYRQHFLNVHDGLLPLTTESGSAATDTPLGPVP